MTLQHLYSRTTGRLWLRNDLSGRSLSAFWIASSVSVTRIRILIAAPIPAVEETTIEIGLVREVAG